MENFENKKYNCSEEHSCVCTKREQIGSGVADLFKILGDRTRLEILFALETNSMCVGEMVDLLGLSQSLISHQLKVLRDSNIVSTKREGTKVIYTLADEHITALLSIAKVHTNEKL